MASLLVFNSTLGATEATETNKLLCFVPEDTNMDVKMIKLGLFEAFVKFSSTFKPNRPCEAVRMRKSRFALREVEPDYWFVLSCDNEDCALVLEDELEGLYGAFKTVHGGLGRVLRSDGPDALRAALHAFFGPAIAKGRGSRSVPGAELASDAFMAYVNGVNAVQQKAPAVRNVMLVNDGALVYSDLPLEQWQGLAALIMMRPSPAVSETLMVFLDERPCKALVVSIGALRVCAVLEAEATTADAAVIRLIQDHIPAPPPPSRRPKKSDPLFMLCNEATGVHCSNVASETLAETRAHAAALLDGPCGEGLSNVVARAGGSWVAALNGNDRQVYLEFPRSDGTLLTVSDDISRFVEKRCADLLL